VIFAEMQALKNYLLSVVDVVTVLSIREYLFLHILCFNDLLMA